MTRRLLISALPGETRAAWLEHGELIDLLVARDDRPGLLGNLYLGRITRLDKGLDAAFVELGLARPGFLPRGEAPRRSLAEGAAVVVRVTREAAEDPAENKGPRLSARILDPPADLERLASGGAAPRLLARGDDPVGLALARGAPPEEVVIDEPGLFAEARARFAQVDPASAPRLTLDLDPAPLFEREGIEARIEALLAPLVPLASGGFLLVEPVRGLTAIDVNSGRHDGRGGPQAAALEVNLEAVPEIARQLRLRWLGGLIVVDFLELRDPNARRQVTERLRAALAPDPEPCRVYPLRPSGLLELTRRRGRPALHEMLTEPCGIGGGGRVKDNTTLAFEALRALRGQAARQPSARLALRAGAALIAALERTAARRAVEQRLGREIDLRADPICRDGEYEIVVD